MTEGAGAKPTVGGWMDVLDALYPPSWAEDWDNPGLQVGDRGWEASSVLVALDPSLEVIEEAADRGCGLLVAHHPLLLRPPARLDLADAVARACAAALASRIGVAACHTNADVAVPGVSDALAEALDVHVTGVLRTTRAGARMKLVTFVPAEATGKVLDAIATAGAGVIGEYSHCSFRVRGSGTFLPSELATPAVGERGALNEVEEDRLEVVLARERLEAVVAALLDAHPYEEVAHDIVPLGGGASVGLGRMARASETVDAAQLARTCEERLDAPVRMAGDASRPAERIALCGGSGSDLIPDAIRAGADVFVTGDLKHHQALDAAAAGLTVIDPGHHGTEQPFVPVLAQALRDEVPSAEVLVSEVSTDPFTRP